MGFRVWLSYTHTHAHAHTRTQVDKMMKDMEKMGIKPPF